MKVAMILNDAVWNNETSPPDEELIDHSYLDRAMQPATSLGFASVVSFVIKMPSSGCHSRGGTDVVGLPRGFLSLASHFNSLRIALELRVKRFFPSFAYRRRRTQCRRLPVLCGVWGRVVFKPQALPTQICNLP